MAEEPEDGERSSCASPSRAAAARASSTGSVSTRGAAEGDESPRARTACRSSSTRSARRTSRAPTIDFLDGLQESGFKIDNPNASSSCGCGHSFQVEEGESERRRRRLRLGLQPLDALASRGSSSRATGRHSASPWSAPGPAGFYAAGASAASADAAVEVDMIERLPTPWGLVRLGVAPDHPNIKAVSRAFERTRSGPASASSATSRSGATCSHDELARALRRGRLRRRRADRPAARHPRRGPARLVGGDRVRRLVQRPPGLPGARVRPLRRARGRDRQRQRRARRRAHARADAGGARADRHDRSGDRGDRAARRSARSSCSAGAARRRRRGRRSSSASWASWRARTSSSTPPSSSSTRRARPSSRRHPDRAAQRRASCASSRRASRPASRARSGCASCARRWRSLGDGRVEAIELVRNELVADERRPRAGGADRRARDDRRAASSSAASATAALPLPGVPFDERAGTMPNEGGRVLDERGEPIAGRLLRRLDQARPERRDRHEQEGRDGDRRAAARGRAGRPAVAAATEPPTRSRRCSRSAGVEPVLYGAGRRSTRVERAARRAARPSARQALHLGRAARPRRRAADAARRERAARAVRRCTSACTIARESGGIAVKSLAGAAPAASASCRHATASRATGSSERRPGRLAS